MMFNQDARNSLLNGINKATQVVSGTLGPAPRLVVIDDGSDNPILLDDGVNITKHISVEDEYEMVGVKLLRMVAHEAQKNSGDGTTTACIVASELINNLFNQIEEEEIHPSILAIRLQEAWDKFKEHLEESSWEASPEEIVQVAHSCVNYDEESANALLSAFDEVGAEGVIMVQQHIGEITDVKITDGLTINRGFVSHLSAGSRDASVEYENPLVLITDHTILTFDEMMPYLKYVSEQGRSLVIISAGMKPHAIQNLLLNAVNGKVNACPINPVATGEERAEIYEDLAIMLGATPILAAKGMKMLDSFSPEVFGNAGRVVIDRNTTVFSECGGDKNSIKDRIEHLEHLSEVADHPFYKEKYQMRKAKLLGQIATIRVGGLTDAEVLERHERIDDGINAIRSALEGGVCIGGGMTLYKAETGLEAFDNALKSIVLTLIKNWGLDFGTQLPDGLWFDAKHGYLTDEHNYLVDAKVVLYNSIKAAVSVAMMVLKTDTILISKQL